MAPGENSVKANEDIIEENLQVDWDVAKIEKEKEDLGMKSNEDSDQEESNKIESRKTNLKNKNDSNNNKSAKNLTPFQEYLEKRKQKRKERKVQIQEAKKRRKEEFEVEFYFTNLNVLELLGFYFYRIFVIRIRKKEKNDVIQKMMTAQRWIWATLVFHLYFLTVHLLLIKHIHFTKAVS